MLDHVDAWAKLNQFKTPESPVLTGEVVVSALHQLANGNLRFVRLESDPGFGNTPSLHRFLENLRLAIWLRLLSEWSWLI
jgi:hypothetical protein